MRRLQVRIVVQFQVRQDWFTCYLCFEGVECLLVFLCPCPHLVFLCKCIERSCDGRKSLDEGAVKIAKTEE